jgi:hypothetical protein
MKLLTSPYAKAALLTVALVLLGFFFMEQLDAMRANELSQSVDQLEFESQSEQLLLLYSQVMSNSSGDLCVYANSTEQARAAQAYALSQQISYYEKSNVFNGEYDAIRDRYYLSNAALYLNMLAMKKYCANYSYTTILFFYKINGDCPACTAQGGVLDSLRAADPNIQVFAFPIDSDVGVVNALAARYNITSVPSLVIGNSNVMVGLQDEQNISGVLAEYQAQGE